MIAVFRALAAVLGGFAAMVLVTMVVHLGLGWGFPEAFPQGDPIGHPATSWVVVLLVGDTLAALAGGVVAVRLARGRLATPGWWLAGVVLVLGIVSTIAAWGQEPAWYQVARTLIAPSTILIGAALAAAGRGEFTRWVRIDRPREQVWAFFEDDHNAGRWMRGLERIERLDGKPKAVGTRFRETRTVMSRTETYEIEIVEHDPPARHAARSSMSGSAFVSRFLFEPTADNSTDVRMVAEAHADGALGRLFLPVGLLMLRACDGDQLMRLKEAVEAGNRAPAERTRENRQAPEHSVN